MKTKFTKGEWTVRDNKINLSVFDELPELSENADSFEALMIDVRKSKPIKNIVLVAMDCVAKKEAEANAKLIAAAPELLEALSDCLLSLKAMDKIYSLDKKRIVFAEQAIKKATE